MARIRYVKPEISEDEILAHLDFRTQFIYIILWCHLDRQGVIPDNPALIRSKIFPLREDVTSSHVSESLRILVEKGRLIQFSHGDKNFLFCGKLAAHQNFHQNEKPKYWIPEEILKSLVQAPYKERTDTTGTGTGIGNREFGTGIENVKIVQGTLLPDSFETKSTDLEKEYLRLYQRYPRKEGKADGLDRCRRLLKTRSDVARCHWAIRKYKKHLQKTGQYAKHFSTFMGTEKVRRWMDWLAEDAGEVTVTSLGEKKSYVQARADRLKDQARQVQQGKL